MTSAIPKSQTTTSQVQQLPNGDRVKAFGSILSGYQFIKIDPNKPLEQLQHPIEKVALKNPLWLERIDQLGLFLLRCSLPHSDIPLPLKSWNIAPGKIHCCMADRKTLNGKAKALFLNILWKGVQNLNLPEPKIVLNDSRILDALLKTCGYEEKVEESFDEAKSSEEHNGVVVVEKDALYRSFRNRVQELLSYQAMLLKLEPMSDQEAEEKRVAFRELKIKNMCRTEEEMNQERRDLIEKETPKAIAESIQRIKSAGLSSVCRSLMKHYHACRVKKEEPSLADIFMEAAFLPVKERLGYALGQLHKQFFGESNLEKMEAFLAILKIRGRATSFVKTMQIEDAALKELCDLEKSLIDAGVGGDKIVFDPGFGNEDERELFFEIRSEGRPIVEGAVQSEEPFSAIRAAIDLAEV